MAEPVGFEGANQVFAAPEGSTNCIDLETHSDGQAVTSCWRLSPEELAEVARTGVVWLRVAMNGRTPPVYVSGEALLMIGDRPSRAEPVIPKRPMKDRG